MAFYLGESHLFRGLINFVIDLRQGFLAFEFPTTYFAQKTRVAKYLGANVIIWGILLMLHSVGGSFGAFFALRFLLGKKQNLCVLSTSLMIF